MRLHFLRSTGRIHAADDLAEFVALVDGPPRTLAYRLALDELSNQLDRLTSLPGDELSLAVKELQLTPFTAERLSDAKLVGEIAPTDVGQRVTLRLTSRDPNGLKVSMAGWMFHSRSLSGGQAK